MTLRNSKPCPPSTRNQARSRRAAPRSRGGSHRAPALGGYPLRLERRRQQLALGRLLRQLARDGLLERLDRDRPHGLADLHPLLLPRECSSRAPTPTGPPPCPAARARRASSAWGCPAPTRARTNKGTLPCVAVPTNCDSRERANRGCCPTVFSCVEVE